MRSRYARKITTKQKRSKTHKSRRQSRRFVGGACPIPGNSTWKDYCNSYPDRVELFLSVLNKLHCSANPGTPLNLKYFADGQCDLVSIAIIETIEKLQKPWHFEWVSSRVNGTRHIFLYDRDVGLYIDLTARQFFSGEDMATIAGTEEQMKALGYKFPVGKEEFEEHYPTVVQELERKLK
jgi:hypothetical protein